MSRATWRGREVAAGVVLACTLLAWCPCAFALEPSLDISQYLHTSWKIREGFSKGSINSIAQTPDGYLWLGTQFGLLRFDGVRNIPWQPPPGQQLPSSMIPSLLAAGDGTLWIGTFKGLARWKDGRLTQVPELAGLVIRALLEDRDGTIWAGGSSILPAGSARLCAILRGSVRCDGEDGRFGQTLFSLYQDRKGNLWAGAATGLWRWKPGPPDHYAFPGQSGITALNEDEHGTLLIATREDLRQLVGREARKYPLPGVSWRFLPRTLFRSGDGSLWIGTTDHGLIHARQGKADWFLQPDGLSSNYIEALAEDREGSIWVGTNGGLDRFRDAATPTFSAMQGVLLPVRSVLAARDGSVWIGSDQGVTRLKDGQIAQYRSRGLRAESLFQDDDGRILVTTAHGVAYFDGSRFVPAAGVPGEGMYAIASDRQGNLWMSSEQHGLIRLMKGSRIEQIPWRALARDDFGLALAADPLQDGLWLGFFLGGVAFLQDGRIRASLGAADGLGEGRVMHLKFQPDGTLWAATEGGLSRIRNGRVATLTSKNGLPCDAVFWAEEGGDRAFWLYTECGLIRVAQPELESWGADPKRRIRVTVFDGLDGVRLIPRPGGAGPRVTKSADGRLWFTVFDGVSVLDPRRLSFNRLPPPTHIEQITADGKTYDVSRSVRLPPLVRDLSIAYNALSLAVPEKVRFRFKLEGQDEDWREVVNQRRVEYSNLAPGNYRFNLTASNNSGVWNDAGAALDFSIDPAYYQTRWFAASMAAAALALLWAAYRVRLRQVAHEFDLRLEERVNERTRIARELHDTLLQSFHGLIFRFQAAHNLLPARPVDAQLALERGLDQAEQAIADGRDAVQDLRTSTLLPNDLAEAVGALGAELAAQHADTPRPALHVNVEGHARTLHPIVRDDVYRIAAEALRNAFRHAEAREIEATIRYGERELEVAVRDDGKGIDPQRLGQQPEGHWGLRGMRERAELIGGTLRVWSEQRSGAQVELTVPASRAYASSPGQRRFRWMGRRTETDA
jgi:signal transduction histidine kinase/ligand-binding sensor domain-containing protein